MDRWSLQFRLFCSHLIVMSVGMLTLLAVGRYSSPRFFILHLEEMIASEGGNVSVVRAKLVQGFEIAWTRGAAWSLVVGGTAAGGLSYLVASRIVRPLTDLEQVTQQFAEGSFQARAPRNGVPELDHLSQSFNHMAASLEGVEQRRRELISDLTHELRTPLTVLEGSLEGLADGVIEPSPVVYERLARESARLRRLVNDLQELSQAEAGYLKINLQPVELRPLLDNLIARFRNQIPEGGPELYLKVPVNLPPALVDPDRLEQVLVNLLSNALRYTNAGEIAIGVDPGDARLQIWIMDTGTGIAPEDLPHVFERFWRADRSRSRDSGGTGLGLAISRRLVELQGGEIEVQSELGCGSTFRVWLPLANSS